MEEQKQLEKLEQMVTINTDIPKEKKWVWWKKGLLIAGIIMVLITIILLYARYIATSGLEVKEYKVTSNVLPKHFHGLKIIHLSDIHYGRIIHEKELNEIVQKVNELKPDIIVLTGDFIDKDTELDDKKIITLTGNLSKMNATIGKYAVTGNHDVKFEDWSTIIKNSNFINLNDTYEVIYANGYEPIMIAGLSSSLNSPKTAQDKIIPINTYIDSLKNNLDPNIPHYKILLLHEPDYIDDITSSNYNLILAGHSHNGQVNIPYLKQLFLPVGSKKYFDPYYKLENTDLYISSGIGTSSVNFRLFNRPSINFYRLTCN